MNVTTPLMDARKIMPTSYVDALYIMFKDMAGSATTLQDDVAGILYTPNNTLTINANNSFDCDDSAGVALTLPAAYQEFAADDDIITLVVCRVSTIGDLANFGVGAGTQGIVNRFVTSGASTNHAIFDDGTNTQMQVTGTITPTPSVSDYVMSAGAWDRSVGSEHYVYNVTTNAAIMDASETGVANAVFTPTSVIRFTNMSDVLLAAMFRFTGDGLPVTWKADMLAMAQAVVGEKG